MPRITDAKADAIRLMIEEASFERSAISGLTCRPDAAPRQEEMPKEAHAKLLADIARGEVTYVVFSYRTPIAWVYRNGAVNLPEIKYSKTTSMHQNWVREAYGDRVNRPGDQPQEQGEVPVVLSENEEIILRRMRDEDGTEYEMAWGDTAGDIASTRKVKFVPSDQVEGLEVKGLVAYRAVGIYGKPVSVILTPKGRAHLDQIQPVIKPKPSAAQYSELGEDDLIEMAVQLTDALFGDDSESGWEADPRVFQDLDAVLRSLKARRDATAPARRRIGEYLRHLDLNDREYERTNGRYTSAREPKDILDELRADEYAAVARLRATDLVQVVEPLVRDSKHEFEMNQATILSSLEDIKLPEKQAALLPCIAKGHIVRHDSGGYSGERGCTCHLPDGRTVNALMNKDFVGTRRGLGYRPRHTLMLVRPTTA